MDIKHFFYLTALLFSATVRGQTSGQNYTLSPYSNFGLGEILNQNFVQAGTNSQTHSGAYSYSLHNPATLGNLKYATFDFGVNGRIGMVSSGAENQSYNGGSLSYLTLAFNLWKKDKSIYKKDSLPGSRKATLKQVRSIPYSWNSYLSLHPSSSIGYNYTFENKTDSLVNRTAHSGSGGVNNFEWGQSLRLGKHISLGMSNAWMFGTVRDNSVFSIQDTAINYNYVEDDQSVRIRGWQHRIGAMFSLGKDSAAHTFGISYGFHSGMTGLQNRMVRTLEASSSAVGTSLFILDTILSAESEARKFRMPTSLALGYKFTSGRKWSLGIDYKRQMWGDFDAFFAKSSKLVTRNDYGLTLTLNPADEKSSREKRMKMPVRLGGSYAQTQNVILSGGTETQINEMRLFTGFGLPLSRRYFDNRVLRSVLHVQIDYMTRGKIQTGLAYERYLVATFSMNLGDIWFQKRKFD
jgi:hypothetical protein